MYQTKHNPVSSVISEDIRKKHKAIRRIGKSMGLLGAQMGAMAGIIEALDFQGILDMQKQMEEEVIAEITDSMVESVMEKTMMDYDAAKALLVSARLDDLWKEDK